MTTEENDIVFAAKMVARRLLVYFPQLENHQDELLSAAGEGVVAANIDYDPTHPTAMALRGWLIFAGEKKALTLLSSPKLGRFIGHNKIKSRIPLMINETDFLWKWPWLTLDIFPDTSNPDAYEYEEEKTEFFLKALSILSKIEKKIFTKFYINGLHYKEITDRYGYSDKQIDNALIRSKMKIRGLIKTHPKLFPGIYDMFSRDLESQTYSSHTSPRRFRK